MSQGNTLTAQAIFNSVSALSSDGEGVLRISAMTAASTVSFAGDAGNNRVSAIQGDAGLLRVSSIGSTSVSFDGDANNNRVSAIQKDAVNLNVSAKSSDAGTLLVSAKSGDAALFRVSATLTGSSYISAYVDNGSISAKSGDANQFHVSAVQGDAGLLHVSVVGTLTVSAHEVKQSDAASLLVSAKSGDANQLHVSAVQGDAGLLRVSAIGGSISFNGDAANNRTSAIQGDAGLLRVSASLNATTDTELSMFSTSAGIAQLSAIKASKANLYGYQLGNRSGVDQWLQIFNASATSAVTLGSTVPDKTVYTPATGGANLAWTLPPTFANGIVIAVTSAPAGSTAGASAMTVNLDYK